MVKSNNFFLTIGALLKETFIRSKMGDPVVYAAAIAFFTIFSLPPTLLIVEAIAGKFFSEQAVKGEIAQQIHRFVGHESAHQIQDILEQNEILDDSTVFLTITGIILFIFSATIAYSFIKKAINSIWNVKPKVQESFFKFVIDRLISFSMVVILGLLVVFYLAIDPLLILLHDYLDFVVSEIHMAIMHTANFLLSVLIFTLLFAVMFKFLPDTKVKWRDVWVGAVVTAVFFKLGNYLISLIFRQIEIALAYGTDGSLAAILLWVFYSTIIFLVGAEFTYVYSQYRKLKYHPGKADHVKVRKIKFVAPQKVAR